MNYSEVYRHGTDNLSAAGISEAALDARLLLEFITGHDTNTLYAHPETEVSDEEAERYEMMIKERAAHIPLQHLTGECDFMGIGFRVSGKALVPRQDSECLVEEAMRYVEDGSRVLDLCTGTGCLLLSLMHYKNGIRGIGTDVSADALEVAAANLKMLEKDGGLNGGDARFYEGDLYDALDGIEERFDYIISNPPYIRAADIKELAPEVRDHDPYIALCGGDDGLVFYRRIAQGAPEYLNRGGMIFFEIGYDQADQVKEILAGEGFSGIEVIKDYCSRDRVVTARYSSALRDE